MNKELTESLDRAEACIRSFAGGLWACSWRFFVSFAPFAFLYAGIFRNAPDMLEWQMVLAFYVASFIVAFWGGDKVPDEWINAWADASPFKNACERFINDEDDRVIFIFIFTWYLMLEFLVWAVIAGTLATIKATGIVLLALLRMGLRDMNRSS